MKLFDTISSKPAWGFKDINRDRLPGSPEDLPALIKELNQEISSTDEERLKELSQPATDPKRFEIRIADYSKNSTEDFFTHIDACIKNQVAQLAEYKSFSEFEASIKKDYESRRLIFERDIIKPENFIFLYKDDPYRVAFASAANQVKKTVRKANFQFKDESGHIEHLIEYSIGLPIRKKSFAHFKLIREKAQKALTNFAELIFNSLQSSLKNGLNTISSLRIYVKKVALLEWLNAHRWKYSRGSAGIAQMMTRIFLDAAKISNGSYKENLDPNMEAFISLAKSYVGNFYSFFDKPLEINQKI